MPHRLYAVVAKAKEVHTVERDIDDLIFGEEAGGVSDR